MMGRHRDPLLGSTQALVSAIFPLEQFQDTAFFPLFLFLDPGALHGLWNWHNCFPHCLSLLPAEGMGFQLAW